MSNAGSDGLWRRRHSLLAAGLVVAAAAPAAVAYITGPPPDRVALCLAGPTCKDSGCHDDFPHNAGLATLRLELASGQPLPATYRRDLVYALRLLVSDPDPTRLGFGFELAAADCDAYLNAGELDVVDPARSQLIADPTGVLYVEHACTALGDPARCGYLSATPGENQWPFEWHPGCSLAAAASFHYAVNAINDDGTQGGDIVYVAWSTMAPPLCPAPDGSLRLVKRDCDPATPGVADVALSWSAATDATGYALYATPIASDLAQACTAPPALTSTLTDACVPLDATPELVFYRLAGLCADGSPGPLEP